MAMAQALSTLHISASILALVLGAWVLIVHKGDRRHRRMGRAYAISMLVVNVTAFGIYRLFGGFGPFHIAAIVSLLTLLAGMRPVLLRTRPKHWYTTHMIFMYWSVVGLYAAFASEVLVRLPERPGAYFGLLVGAATAVIMGVAGLLQGRLVKRWSAEVGALP